MREREKGVKDKLKLAGTQLGDIMGVKEEDEDDEKKVREEVDKANPGPCEGSGRAGVLRDAVGDGLRHRMPPSPRLGPPGPESVPHTRGS